MKELCYYKLTVTKLKPTQNWYFSKVKPNWFYDSKSGLPATSDQCPPKEKKRKLKNNIII
jgi:hypothetical protein